MGCGQERQLQLWYRIIGRCPVYRPPEGTRDRIELNITTRTRVEDAELDK